MRLAVPCTLIAVFALIAACGGGSSGTTDPTPTPTPTASPTPGPTGDARTQEMLQDCLPASLNATTAWLNALGRIVGGTGSTAGVSILGGGVSYSADPDAMFLDVQWTYDPNGDMMIDGSGSFHFVDADGADVLPFSPADAAALQASESIDDFGLLYLPTAPEGTHMLVDFNAPPPATLNIVSLDLTLGPAGTPGATDGSAESTVLDCSMGFAWTGITLANLQGNLASTFPTGTWTLAVSADVDALQGTLTMDGTRTATASVSRNGMPATAWSIDLVTGVATQQ
jgi:hypothetical protein